MLARKKAFKGWDGALNNMSTILIVTNSASTKTYLQNVLEMMSNMVLHICYIIWELTNQIRTKRRCIRKAMEPVK